MRERLQAAGVTLIPDHADADAFYEGAGEHAQHAWRVFCALALEPVSDPVAHAGLLFSAAFTDGWAARDGEPEVPEHFELVFTRAFDVGEDGELWTLELVVRIAAADELRALTAQASKTLEADVQGWITEVETSPAFVESMTRHEAIGFQFGIDEIC